jgi:hypothetical protein
MNKLRTHQAMVGVVSLLLLTPFVYGQTQLNVVLQKLTSDVAKGTSSATPEVRKELSEVPSVQPQEVHEINAPQAPPKKIVVVNNEQKAALISAIDKFTKEKRHQQSVYSTWALTFLVAGVVLALVGSILNFIKWNTLAGIVGLIVVATVGFPNVYPLPALADFYNILAAQALALRTDCELRETFTEDDYKASENQLKLLILYEANNHPKFGSAKSSTEDLVQKLQTARTVTGVASTPPAN